MAAALAHAGGSTMCMLRLGAGRLRRSFGVRGAAQAQHIVPQAAGVASRGTIKKVQEGPVQQAGQTSRAEPCSSCAPVARSRAWAGSGLGFGSGLGLGLGSGWG